VNQADNGVEPTGEDDRDARTDHAGASHHIEIGQDAHGPVVAGDHNLVIDARHGSSVTVRMERERPAPVRRERISVLPRRTREPLGREAEATELAAAIATGGPVQLCGPAGIGKSTLLRRVARTVKCGPDGVVFVSAAHRQVADLAQEIFEACYETRGYAPSRRDLRRLLTGLRITVYVDNADLTIEQLRELTDAVPDATFVLASRHGSLLGDGAVLYLGGLGQLAATQLLARALDRPLRDAERATAADLWQAAGGSPLLLLRAAGLARSGRSVLPAPGAVADLLPLLLKQLNEPAVSALNLLATLEDAELTAAHVGALVGEADPATLCERLADLGLAVPAQHGYRCAPGVVPALRHRNVVAFPVERLCQYFTQWARDPATTPAQIADHSRAFEKTAGLATEVGRPELAVLLGRAASPKLAHSLRFDAWGQLLGRGWSAARRAGDRRAEAFFTHEEGIRCLVTGRRVAAAALLAEAVVLWNVLGEHQGTTAASDAQQFLPQAPQPPGQMGEPEYPVSDGSDTSHVVADHMAELECDPAVQAAAEPMTATPYDGAGPAHTGADPATYEVPTGPDPTYVPGESAAVPGGGDFGATAASATGSVPSAGAAATGATAVPGATAATGAAAVAATGGASLLTMVLIVISIVGAITVGVVVSQDDEEIGIAGTWEDTQGNRSTIAESAPGAYTMPGPCGYDDIELLGDDTEVTGEAPLIDISDGSCGPVIGYVVITIAVAPEGDTAQLMSTMPSGQVGPNGEEVECLTCGTITMTRVE